MALLSPASGSIIDNANGTDRTGTSLSTTIVIKVGATPVGAVQNLTVNEARQIQMIDEVGYDGHIDSTPVRATNITGSCRRIRFDRLRVAEAFSRDFLHVHSQRIPFDIDVYDNWNGDGSNSIITTIRNVWISSIGYQYQADNFVNVDDMNWEAEAIYSTLNGGNAATGGERGASILQRNPIEAQSDKGLRRGSLSAPGLINDLLTGI